MSGNKSEWSDSQRNLALHIAAMQREILGKRTEAPPVIKEEKAEEKASKEGDAWYWDMATAFAAERFEEMLAFWKPGCFINVNIPGQKETPSGLVHAFPSLRYYNDSIETYYAPDGHRYCFAKAGKIGVKPEKGSDWEAVAGSNASISDILIHPALLGRNDVGKQVRME